MGQLEDILKHQNMVRNNIMKSFGAETSEDSLEKSFEDEVNPFEMEAYKSELTKAELDEFEKAKHQDGDMHPNGKWVWRQSANGGKGDWRVAKPSRGGGSSKTTSSSSSSDSKTTKVPAIKHQVDNFMYTIQTVNSNFTDESKVTVVKTDKGNWDTYYDGKRVGIVNSSVLSEKVAKEKGWLKEDGRNNEKTTPKKTDSSSKKTSGDFDGLSSAKTQLEVNKFWSNLLTSNSGKGQNIAGKLLDSIKESGYRNLSGGMTVSGKEVYTYTNKDADKNIKILPAIDGVVIKTNDKREVLKVSDFKTVSDFKKKFEETVLVLSGNVSNKKTTNKTDSKKKSESKTYASDSADAYDKGDGKVGNYPVPTHTSYSAANLYSRLKNNRHFGFKYGLPEEEIMKKLKDYKGNVKVSYHNNAGTSEIYRIKFL